MSPQTIHVLVEVTIYEGKLDAFEGIAREMVAGSQSESGTLGYEWYLSIDHRRCRIFETYADSVALLAHFNGPVVQQLVRKLLEQCRVDRSEVYGDPSPAARAMLTGFGAEVFDRWEGFSR
jgi:quinol monooxygenase YgiN